MRRGRVLKCDLDPDLPVRAFLKFFLMGLASLALLIPLGLVLITAGLPVMAALAALTIPVVVVLAIVGIPVFLTAVLAVVVL